MSNSRISHRVALRRAALARRLSMANWLTNPQAAFHYMYMFNKYNDIVAAGFGLE